jgi:prepilin-type processing-associated H-X9-DG protein
LIGSNDLTDGAASTLLLTEKRNSQGWAVGGWAGSEFDVGTSPAMNTGDKWGDMVYSGSYHPGGVNVVACDGSAHFVTATMNRKLWYALITRDGGEPVDEDGGTLILGNKP